MKENSGINHLAKQIEKDLQAYLPRQRKTQRENLSLLTATMLIEKSANTMDLAAALPRDAQRIDMRYQWISRVLGNHHIQIDSIMKAVSTPLLKTMASKGEIIILLIDQTTAGNGDEILMLSLRFGNRALPLFWHVKKTKGNIGFAEQKKVLDQVLSILPKKTKVVLLGDRFYGTGNLVDYCNKKDWDYRFRLKGNTRIQILNENIAADEIAHREEKFIQNAFLASSGCPINLGFINESGHPKPWIIVMKSSANYYTTLDYGMRWSIESMFSDFKSRGFGLEDTQLRYSERVSRLILIMSLAIYFAVTTGLWEEEHSPLPMEKKRILSTS